MTTLRKSEVLAEVRVVLLRAVERRERVVVPDVPADALGRRDFVGQAIQVPVGVVQRFVPQALPRQDFRVLHEQPPERDEGAVDWFLAASRGALPAGDLPKTRCPGRELRVAVTRAIDVDALGARGIEAVVAEARDAAACAGARVVRNERVPERSLPLAAPHQPVHVVGAQVVLDQSEPEVARVRIARARKRGCRAAVDDLTRLVETRHVGCNDVLEPADHLHAAAVRRRQHLGDRVVGAVVRRLLGLDRRVLVVSADAAWRSCLRGRSPCRIPACRDREAADLAPGGLQCRGRR